MKSPLDMTDDELNATLRGTLFATTSWTAGQYIDELNRRAAHRQAHEMIRLTGSIEALTGEIRSLTRLAMLLAAAALVIAVVGLLKP